MTRRQERYARMRPVARLLIEWLDEHDPERDVFWMVVLLIMLFAASVGLASAAHLLLTR